MTAQIILDLGCGSGCDLSRWGIRDSDSIVGLDVDEQRLAIARERYPMRIFVQGCGERIPYPQAFFHRAICDVAMPYMNIPVALAELDRVLKPGGIATMTLHGPGFTMAEMWRARGPKALLGRLFVLLNGACFFCFGRLLTLRGRSESFQTSRGMRMASQRAGFANCRCWHDDEEFYAEVRKRRTVSSPGA